jgi:predicted CopG family antitoxin
MSEVTTIQLPKEVLLELKKTKKYPRQSYAELLSDMIDTFKQVKRKNQYDEFLHNIQQRKMKELWDNKDDEIWEKA